jgi:hypothetical protein
VVEQFERRNSCRTAGLVIAWRLNALKPDLARSPTVIALKRKGHANAEYFLLLIHITLPLNRLCQFSMSRLNVRQGAILAM